MTDDVVSMLLAQHVQLRRLMEEMDFRGNERSHTFQALIRLFSVHETAEEEVVWPILRESVYGGDILADDRIREEAQTRSMLADLEHVGVDGFGFDRLFGAFRTAVLDHVEREEREVFPTLRAAESAARLEQLAHAVAAAEALAPHHPRTAGADTAVRALLVAPAVAIADRARDAIRQATGTSALD